MNARTRKGTRNVFEEHRLRIQREDERMPEAIRNVMSPSPRRGTVSEAEYADRVAALGAPEVARRQREQEEGDRAFKERTAPLLAAQGYRYPTEMYEPGAHYVWLRIDDREIDDGLCKMWVVKL